ncbi:MAG: hypothetical protein GY696_11395 [Gammaproteobacteria bacterium]|nr:hypothetical protein [Gammaproteobacteria bacterium]
MWPARQRKLLVIQYKNSFEGVHDQVRASLEREAVAAAKSEEEIQALLDKDHDDNFDILLTAQGMISTLSALSEEFKEMTLLSSKKEEETRKWKWDEEDRNLRMEHEADDLKEKTRLSEKKLEYEREENERKYAPEMKKLELQQISENQKAELASERLKISR